MALVICTDGEAAAARVRRRSREPSGHTRSRRIQRDAQRDGVDELGVRVEGDVHLVPQARLDRERLAAAARDGARGVDLVGGAAEDDELAGELVAMIGERERRGHDRAGDHAVPARVHGLDLAVLADRLDGVVQADDADRAPGRVPWTVAVKAVSMPPTPSSTSSPLRIS